MPRIGHHEPSPPTPLPVRGWQGEVLRNAGVARGKNPHPSPSPGARERGVLPWDVGADLAWLRHILASRHPFGSPLPRTGRGVGGEGSLGCNQRLPKYLPLPAAHRERGFRACCS